MPEVQWKTISLTGFGVYREGVEVQLEEGLNVLVAPNEAGKSTLVAGLRAVLFGLANVSADANLNTGKNSFSNVRFRSWQGADAFYGEVTFTVDGRLYRIKRQFDTHEVTVSSLKNGEWEDTDYIHNPQAHKDSGRYLEELQKLIGITGGEALTDTFYVEQPLPQGDELSEHVQTLLSGSGGHFLKALEELEAKLSRLTRRLKNYGFKRDKNKDRQLEELEKQIESLQNRIETGKTVAAELQATLLARTQLEEELDGVKKKLAVKKQLQEAWKEGRQRYERYLELLNDQKELRGSQAQLQALEGEIAGLRRELNRDFELFLTAPEELPEELDQLIKLEQELDTLNHQIRKMEGELETKLDLLEKIKPDLEQLQAFSRNPHLLAGFREYQKLDEEYRQLCIDVEKLKETAADCQRRLKLLPDWHRLGEDPLGELKELRAASFRISRFWRQLENFREELSQIRVKLAGEYACFGELTADQEEALADYSVLKLKMETDYREKERVHRESREKLELLGRMKETRQKSASTKSLIAAGSLALAGAVIGLWAGEFSGLSLGLVLGAVLGWVAGKFLFRNNELQGAAGEEKSLLDKLPELETAFREARERLEEFHRKLAEQEAVFGDSLPQAYADFRKLLSRQRELEEEKERLTREEFLLDSFELPKEQWPDFWRRLRDLGELWGQEFHHLTEIIQWILSLDDTWWQAALNSCSEWEQLCKKLEDINAKGLNIPEHYEEQLAGLKEQVAPYRLDTPLSQVEEDALNYQQLREENRGIKELIDQLETQLTEAKAQRTDLAKRQASLKTTHAVYLSLGQGDSQTTKKLWQSFQEKQEALHRLEDNRKVLLRGIQVADSEELAEKVIDLDNRVNYSLSRLEELTEKYPGLPSFAQNRDHRKLEQEYRELEEEVRALELREEKLKEEERELGLKQATLEGQEPINLAQAELELAELEAEKKQLEFEAEAIGIAYQGLSEAINKYNASYRERLAQQATRYFQRLTGSDRTIEFEDNFSVKVTEEGKKRQGIQFSQGTRDQLFLAMRLAIGDLLAEEIKLPFILDDPFLNYDSRRLEELRSLLRQMAEERQIFLLSHREELAAWGIPVTMTKE